MSCRGLNSMQEDCAGLILHRIHLLMWLIHTSYPSTTGLLTGSLWDKLSSCTYSKLNSEVPFRLFLWILALVVKVTHRRNRKYKGLMTFCNSLWEVLTNCFSLISFKIQIINLFPLGVFLWPSQWLFVHCQNIGGRFFHDKDIKCMVPSLQLVCF